MRPLVKVRLFISLLVAGLLVALANTPSQAGVLYAGSNGTLSATADFELSGTTLTVTLTNTSAAGSVNPSKVLTAVLFNVPGLTPLSAAVNAGSYAMYTSATYPGTNPGVGWVYQTGLSGAPQNMTSGISASGLGVFSNNGFFSSNPQTPLDGANYGIVSHLTTSNQTALSNLHGPVYNDSLVFTLKAPSGLTEAKLESELGSKVVFQFGTSLSEPSFAGPMLPPSPVPEPASLALMGLGLGSILIYRRFRG